MSSKPISKPIHDQSRFLHRLSVCAVIALSITWLMGKSYQYSQPTKDSSVHSSLALDITSKGPRPSLPIPIRDPKLAAGSSGIDGFNDHPFTLLYLNGWVMRTLGPSAWSARLVPSLFAVGCVALTSWLGTLLYSPVVGLVAGLVLLLIRDFRFFGAAFQFDAAMLFFILLSFIHWRRGKWLWAGVFAGIGVWMKNPVALLLFPAALTAEALSGRLEQKRLIALLKSALIGLVVASLIWVLTGLLGGWDLVSDYWGRQVIGTVIEGRGHTQNYGFWSFIHVLKRNGPLHLFILGIIVVLIRNKQWRRPEFALPLAAGIVVLIVISAMSFKHPHYYLPAYPFFALIIAGAFQEFLNRHQILISKLILFSGFIIPSILLATPIDLAREKFPGLRRFNAIIAGHGSCTDKVFFIKGHQPYGRDRDAIAEINFYSGRPAFGFECDETNPAIEQQHPQWIVVSGPNLTDCINEKNRREFPVIYQFGNQYLLSAIIDAGAPIDLTPLLQELEAPNDCSN